jgi:hypothetical protein
LLKGPRAAEALSERVIAIEISNRNVRVAAFQKRWNRLNKAFDEVLDHRGADMADIPGGAAGLLCKQLRPGGSRKPKSANN